MTVLIQTLSISNFIHLRKWTIHALPLCLKHTRTRSHTLANWNETSSETEEEKKIHLKFKKKKIELCSTFLRLYGWHHLAFNVHTHTRARERAGMCQLTPVRSDVIRTVPWVALLLHGSGCKQHAYTRHTRQTRSPHTHTHAQAHSFIRNKRCKRFRSIRSTVTLQRSPFCRVYTPLYAIYPTYLVPEHFSLRLRLLLFFSSSSYFSISVKLNLQLEFLPRTAFTRISH